MPSVTSTGVADYRDHVHSLAKRRAWRGDVEFDDLVQEGMIAVWQTLRRGLLPSTLVIEGRMEDWARFIRRLKRNDAVAYDLLLPIEDYEGVI